MVTKYVYLIKSQQRLVIIKLEHEDMDYLLLMTSTWETEEKVDSSCRNFCAGFVLGNNMNIELVNDINEFL